MHIFFYKTKILTVFGTFTNGTGPLNLYSNAGWIYPTIGSGNLMNRFNHNAKIAPCERRRCLT